jgi:hypothetical protein
VRLGIDQIRESTWSRTLQPVAVDAWIVPRAFVTAGDDATLARIATVDHRSAVFLEADPLTGTGARQPFQTAQLVRPAPDRIEIRCETQASGLLVVRTTWMPGWSATLNGRPVAPLRGDLAFCVIPLRTAGTHDIRLAYHAPALWPAFGVSLLTLALTLAITARTIVSPRASRDNLSQTRALLA